MPVFRLHQNWNPLRDLEQEVDRLLKSMHLSLQGVRLGRQFPAMNLYELEKEFLVTAELPGTRLEDLDLTVADGALTLKGKRDDLAEISDQQFRRSERFHGSWQRSFPLPERVVEEELAATFTNGVLKIKLPKAPDTTPRRIEIVSDAETNGDQSQPMTTDNEI
ncbi:Hsp20/alpha crystallin family protein [Calycomorphotria hydatis]|uniref:Spore protein SP21 n=1 Tax=Calycomorphotria hydatis TaxID=2528027 RepID=A0A517T9P2_9PLAN|nr:Hsp20/alpha crystallin family protein [Calycomorphotria hydatis]QDT65088.1 Spore protein SP21 [Calycomorphotria hydatis]